MLAAFAPAMRLSVAHGAASASRLALVGCCAPDTSEAEVPDLGAALLAVLPLAACPQFIVVYGPLLPLWVVFGATPAAPLLLATLIARLPCFSSIGDNLAVDLCIAAMLLVWDLDLGFDTRLNSRLARQDERSVRNPRRTNELITVQGVRSAAPGSYSAESRRLMRRMGWKPGEGSGTTTETTTEAGGTEVDAAGAAAARREFAAARTSASSGATRRGRVRRLSEARFPPFLLFYTSVMMINMGFTRNSTRDRDLADVNVLARGGPL